MHVVDSLPSGSVCAQQANDLHPLLASYVEDRLRESTTVALFLDHKITGGDWPDRSPAGTERRVTCRGYEKAGSGVGCRYRPKKQVSTFFVAGAAGIGRLGRGMTRHARAHIVCYLFGDHVALSNRSMAGLARCACLGVHTVAEVNEARESIDANPGDRRLLLGGCSKFLDVRTLGLDGLMTGHAKTLRRISHELTRFGVFVTRVALEAKGQVRFMIVGDRLLLAIQPSGQQQQWGKSKDCDPHFGVT